MRTMKTFGAMVLAAASLALADGQSRINAGEGPNRAATSAGSGAYFAPAMRFDANAGSLEVTFGIEEGARVSLLAYDSQGKVLATLFDAEQASGYHHLSLFCNRLQGYQGHVIFQLRAGQDVLGEMRARPR
jgi:hypothetical protein